LPYLATLAAVAAAYLGAARLGLGLGVVEQVTAFWPPTGIALAVTLLLGYRVWPGITLGAFLANLLAHEPILTAAGIAAGNTLEALAGAWLLRRAGFRPSLARLRDVLGLVFLAAACSTLLSAAIGVLSLCLGGVHPWSAYGVLWSVWWLGDAMGNLVMAPLLLTWASARRPLWHSRRALECAGLLAALASVSLIALAGQTGSTARVSRHLLEYAVFPCVIWAALRFGPAQTALVTFVASGAAVWGAVHGAGPFTAGTLHERLVLLQVFLAIVAVTGLVLAAAVAERDTAARHRAAAHAVTQVLAQSATFAEAASGVLPALCRGLGWDLGALWSLDPDKSVLRCLEVWQGPQVRAFEFEALTRRLTFPCGVGMPGRIWASGQPAWIPDILRDDNFPRAEVAAREGLRGAFGLPIVLEGKTLGALEFFSQRPREPDPDLLRLLASLGSQIGLFVQRCRADEALRQGHAILRAVTEGTTDAIFVKDCHGRYLMINSAGARLLGKAVAEVLGKDDSELFSPDTGRAIMARDRAVMASAQVQTYEEVGTAAGFTRIYLSTKGPYRDAQGNVIGLIGISRDITERRQAEEERDRLLEREQAARAEAEHLYRQAREADRRKDEFLAMLAHELRNPLAPIRNAVEALRLLGPSHPNLRDPCAVIARQVAHLVRLVDDLLDVSRITRGKVNLRKEPIELAAVVTRAVETVRHLITARRQELTVSLPGPEPLRLQADPTRLEQVLANLLNNAAKYTEPGGRIELTARTEEGQVVLGVRDTGIGIAAEMLPRVFDLFAQGERSLDRGEGGLGVGLTLVKGLVELHGGTVEARSDGPGHGSEFRIRLPLLIAECGVRSAGCNTPGAEHSRADLGPAVTKESFTPQSALRNPHSKRVLVVDDNRDTAESLALVLRLRGHEVWTAYDGPAALQQVCGCQPEAVLLDIGLPGLDGYQVARRLRGEMGCAALLVAVTGYGQEDDRRRAYEAGFDHHLTKPIDLEELAALLAAPIAVSGS
jgi:PAS domain S-box-containing protein